MQISYNAYVGDFYRYNEEIRNPFNLQAFDKHHKDNSFI